ncbi:NAD(P)/FAD-dependent oxidoreductase [Cytophagales bacterium LB-30]|uniref:NAD(P)/FAD-dependent oxidoreductase n=1 Tax=Shiella aurantiaca TaxID=3058365 RepID=A0ABT8F884_9BACT|nr:NAD(P)/FAD-dependent oxidoreductase [Shiella aurantiaca]MDN4166454.1 NAD(P)/FAD-dependent oxidoreductase [Shiella aurantiaca]
MERYDVCIIGAGPSGYAAAMRALDFKKKVVMIERARVGGAGIINGALSSKTWWELSRDISNLYKHMGRLNMPKPDVSFMEVRAEVEKASEERISLLQNHMEAMDSKTGGQLLTYIEGNAQIIGPHEVKVTTREGSHILNTENIIIATGSKPRKLPHIPIDEKVILTSDGIDKMDHFPASMVILGAGVIGCEFATIFSNFGKTKVHLIDKGDRILPFEDEDVVNVIEKNLESKGVLIHRNSQLTYMKVTEGHVEYELVYDDGHKEVFHVEKALVSVGREPNIQNLWTENVNIEMSGYGYIKDYDTQTSIPSIYAVGDITADIALVNVGELEGRYAIEKMFSTPKRKLMYENISTIMFLNPEVAGVGLNETTARKQGLCYRVVSLDYSCIARATAMRNTQGFVKVLVTDDEEMKILGMRVVGQHASSAIQAVALLISMDKGIEELAELIHPHPSITEGIQECVRMLLGKSTLKPSILRDHMVCRTCKEGVYEDLVF